MRRYAITVAFELEVGARGRFVDLVTKNAQASIEGEPRCLRFDVLAPIGADAPDVLLYEIYADRSAFDDHIASDHYREFDTATKGLVRRKTVLEFTVAEHTK